MSWWQLSRLGLVQAAIGAVVVLLTTTINRVIVVELSLPASVPGLLVALHFGVQRFGIAFGLCIQLCKIQTGTRRCHGQMVPFMPVFSATPDQA